MKQDTFIKLWIQHFGFTPKPSGNFLTCRCIMAPHTSAHKNNVDTHPGLSILVRPGRDTICKCYVCGEEKFKSLLKYLDEYAIKANCPEVLEAFKQAEDNGEFDPPPITGIPTDHEEEEQDYTNIYTQLNGTPDTTYLNKKGITQETARIYGTRSHEAEFKLAKELKLTQPGILIPYFTRDGKTCIGIKYRPYHHSNGPKYWFLCRLSVGHHVYGVWALPEQEFDADEPENRLYLCEGEFDVMHFKDIGRHALAVSGSTVTEPQADEIATLTDSIFLVGDPDPAGKKFADKAVKVLAKVGVTAYPLYPDKDPRTLTAPELDAMAKRKVFIKKRYGG